MIFNFGHKSTTIMEINLIKKLEVRINFFLYQVMTRYPMLPNWAASNSRSCAANPELLLCFLHNV